MGAVGPDLVAEGQTLDNEATKDQYDRLNLGRPLVLESLITVRNVFPFYLEKHSLNGFRPSDTPLEVISQIIHPTNMVWPYNVSDDSATFLVGKKEESANFFYTYYRQCLHH
ncbi:hypothetical protein J1N35_014487 [Gossypium stocksii]|uniref:Uncharacterized protein n=1 Tax=Gossypium stocksii TaxID=47602 RepID=A0A9D4A9T9_9ROSI|nr:hypothetical protein J1N35_014487 [Gossypium stocksii]